MKGCVMKMTFSAVARKACIFSVALMCLTLAQAQTTRTNRPGGLRDFSRGAEMSGTGRFAPGLERLMGVLTADQKTSLRQAMEDQREKSSALDEKLRLARREMFEAALGKKFDEEAVRAKAMAAGKLDAELTVLRMKAFSKMEPALTPDQLSKLRGPGEQTGEIRGVRPRRGNQPVDENGLPLKKETTPEKSDGK
jgi:Spy/CpxP family protein refolding chaperone